MCAPHASGTECAAVLANDRLAEGVGELVLDAPRTAAAVLPGQFVHVRVERGADYILRRPFSVHRVSGERIHLLYQVLGRGTRALASAARGHDLDLLGPLGNGWRIPERAAHALLVAGGLGIAPMGMLLAELAERGVAASVAYGAPTRERLVAREVAASLARRIEVATDDGSEGHHGLVTGLASKLLADDRPDVIYACGPEAMQRAVATMAAEAGVGCQVSLERLMACGVGACLSCVVSTAGGRVRACVEGPVFDAATVFWDMTEIPPRH